VNTHQQIKECIPWFVNGTLDESEQDSVNTHIEGCEECRQELQQVITTAQGFRREDSVQSSWANELESRRVRSFAQLSQRINTSTSEGVKPEPRTQWRWAMAASVLVAGIGMSSFMLGRLSQDAEYVGLTSNVLPTENVLQVVFHPSVSDADIQKIVADNGGEVLGSASPRQVYRVALPEDIDLGQLSKQLRQDPAISWIEVELR
jgi:anti-sigma factor RsiW